MTAADYDRLDAFDSQCLRKILGIRWQDFVTNMEVRHRTQQSLASLTLKARRLSLFGHTSRLPPTSDTRIALAGALALRGSGSGLVVALVTLGYPQSRTTLCH